MDTWAQALSPLCSGIDRVMVHLLTEELQVRKVTLETEVVH